MLAEVMPVDLPHVPGYDAAGVVDEVGDGVEGVAVGDEVFGFTAGSGGGYAEYALLDRFAAKPAGAVVRGGGGAGRGRDRARACSTCSAATAQDDRRQRRRRRRRQRGRAARQRARRRGRHRRRAQPRVAAVARGRTDDVRRGDGGARRRARRRGPRVRHGRPGGAAASSNTGPGEAATIAHLTASTAEGHRRGGAVPTRSRRRPSSRPRAVQPAGDQAPSCSHAPPTHTASEAATSAASSSCPG